MAKKNPILLNFNLCYFLYCNKPKQRRSQVKKYNLLQYVHCNTPGKNNIALLINNKNRLLSSQHHQQRQRYVFSPILALIYDCCVDPNKYMLGYSTTKSSPIFFPTSSCHLLHLFSSYLISFFIIIFFIIIIIIYVIIIIILKLLIILFILFFHLIIIIYFYILLLL